MCEAIRSRPSVELGLDGPTAMGRDLANLDLGRLVVRVYTWAEAWVTIGRNQAPERTLVDPAQTKWIHRPTGGGAVLHGHDVTVGIVLPFGSGNVEDTYRFATAPLVEALNSVGIDCALSADLGAPRSVGIVADCFAFTSSNDIVDRASRRKVVGCALRRTRDAVLLQASIPVSIPERDPGSIIQGAVSTGISNVDPEFLFDALSRCLLSAAPTAR